MSPSVSDTDLTVCDREPIHLLGGIQPGPLAAYLGAIKAGGIADDGLMQRFQLVVWPDPSPEWRNVDEWPDAGAKQEAFDSFVRASALVPSDFSAEQPEGGGIAFLRFEPDAQIEFDQWRHRRIEQGHRGQQHHRDHEGARLPPGTRRSGRSRRCGWRDHDMGRAPCSLITACHPRFSNPPLTRINYNRANGGNL